MNARSSSLTPGKAMRLPRARCVEIVRGSGPVPEGAEAAPGTSQRDVPTLNGSSVPTYEELAARVVALEARVAALLGMDAAALSAARKFAMVGYTSNVELSPAEFALYLGASERWVSKHWHSFTERKHERGGKRWIHLATNQEATWRRTF